MNKAVGLEGIAFAIPKYYVDMEELAIAEGRSTSEIF